MTFPAEIESLVRAFEDGSLPRERWTHEAHLLVALYYLMRDPFTDASRHIHTGIFNYNRLHGREAAYDPQLTASWIARIHAFIARHPNHNWHALAPLLLATYTNQNLQTA